MPRQSVFVVPGLLGTEMETHEPILPNSLWVNPVRLALGHVEALQLSAAGILPGPDGSTCYALGPLPNYYGNAVERLEEELDEDAYIVRPFGYDWRRDLVYSGNRLYEAIIGNASANNPCSIVAHSQGGLVARMAWYILAAQGQTDRVRRIVTIGTPHEGSYSPALCFGGDDEVIEQIRRAEMVTAGLQRLSTVAPLPGLPHSAQEIADIAATWPSMYQLLPLVNETTLARDPDRAALYNRSNWPDRCEVSASHLAYANGGWNAILNSPQSQPPDTVLIAIGARGFGTPSELVDVSAIGGPDAYDYTPEGDGRVTVDSAIPPWATGEIVYGQHGELMKRPVVLGSLRYWVEVVFSAPPQFHGAVSLPRPASQAPVIPIVQGPPFTVDPPVWYDP